MTERDEGTAPLDTTQARFGFGKGGVPWYLLIFYLSFLVFFVWYVLEYQLPNYLDEKAAADEAAVTVEEPDER